MKIKFKQATGNVLFGTIITTGIICVYLGSYLTLVRNENQLTKRSETWNTAIPIAEAGIEEALSRLKWDKNISATDHGWSLVNGYYVKTNKLSADEHYVVAIIPGIAPKGPTIISEGFVRPSLRTNFVSRIIRVETIPRPLFGNGMVADQSVDLNGKALMMDSFDSTNPLYSTGGLYDKAKRRDKGSVATNSGLTNAMDTGSAQIYGKIATGAGGHPEIGARGRVGDIAFVDAAGSANNGKIQTDHWSDDVNVVVDPIEAPFSSALTPPKNVTLLGTKYDYVLTASGSTTPTDYRIGNPDSFNGKVLITGIGTVRLYVTSSTFSFTGSDFIQIAPGANLEVYVETPTAVITGGSIQNMAGMAGKFTYYGLPGNTSLEFKGNGGFTGAIYAPTTAFKLDGSGTFSGASVTKTVEMKGNYDFHYDESLARTGAVNGYLVTFWDEKDDTWQTILAKN